MVYRVKDVIGDLGEKAGLGLLLLNIHCRVNESNFK